MHGCMSSCLGATPSPPLRRDAWLRFSFLHRDKRKMCTGERSTVWGARDFKNVYEEPACLRRSDPWGDTCTRRTILGLGVAVSFVFFTFFATINAASWIPSSIYSLRYKRFLQITLMQSFEIWKHYAYFTKTKGVRRDVISSCSNLNISGTIGNATCLLE